MINAVPTKWAKRAIRLLVRDGGRPASSTCVQTSWNGIRRRSLFVLALVIAISVLPLVAQQQPADRVKAIGGKFLCMCGCNQVLTQCNHVGCTMSAAMLKNLGEWVNRGDSEATITQAFVQQFGTTVYAEPPKTGYSMIAWAMPAVYFVIGAALVLFVISRWRKRPQAAGVDATAPVTATGVKISQEAMERGRAQAARETED
jgi:cytochrome c-type biogenesis protein CcmH/NrfF